MSKPDMSITVGHIIDNPTFDVNCYYKIVDGADGETVLHQAYGGEDCPAELLIRKVGYVTIRNDALIIEAKMSEE